MERKYNILYFISEPKDRGEGLNNFKLLNKATCVLKCHGKSSTHLTQFISYICLIYLSASSRRSVLSHRCGIHF